MEMKHEQNHMSVRCSNHGFTLVELMIALVVSLLALAAIYSTFRAQHRSYQIQSETADMQQNIRTAMYYMQREIRMAGSNPKKTLPLSDFGIKTAGQNTITFTEDVRGPDDTDPSPENPAPLTVADHAVPAPRIAREAPGAARTAKMACSASRGWRRLKARRSAPRNRGLFLLA